MKNRYAIGVDVGGSHICCAVVDLQAMSVVEGSVVNRELDNTAGASRIAGKWAAVVGESIRRSGVSPSCAGFALPGPFDYGLGVSHIEGVEKFDGIFGLDVRTTLTRLLAAHGVEEVRFLNDASAFALGECAGGAGRGTDKVVVITLGTGFGSGFVSGGRMVDSGDRVPANGWMYCLPFEGGIADEKFTTRWFTGRYKELTGIQVAGAREVAEKYYTDPAARQILDEYGDRLADFIAPVVRKFGAGAVVVGGNISRAFDLFGAGLRAGLASRGCTAAVRPSVLNDTAAVTGAASLFLDNSNDHIMSCLRKTTQHILPVKKESPNKGNYDIYPTHDLGGGKIFSGYESLARRLAGHRTVVVDGYGGVRFDLFRQEMDRRFASLGVEVLWWDVSTALKDEAEIDRLAEPFLGGDDPIFGTRTTLQLRDIFDPERLAGIRPDPSARLNILTGEGAALAGWNGPLVYLDIPKNEIQFRARAGSITNLGVSRPDDSRNMYKRFYFVDWVMLNRHKKELLPRVDVMVDAQRENEITWTSGDDLREGLKNLSTGALRVRPWFEPGIWGGKWIKENIPDLAQDVPNYAWSFELIVPENGIIFSSDDLMLEVSFDSVMYIAGEKMVGSRCYKAYGDEFPLRMDYLDTFDGGNLSVQCHPQLEYCQKNFGEVMTQEETYYMLDSKEGSVVYLGFQDDIVPQEFEKALCESFDRCTELDVDKYVQSLPARKHDLFLIPPGTLHSSGKDNLVLEISTTPYIFTFKMYDWLARDLEGKPRPLNIRRGMENLCFERKGEVVPREHVSHPVLLENGADWELWHLPTHPRHSYDVHRYKIGSRGEVGVATAGRFHAVNLVEGESVEVVTASGQRHRLNYAETLIISAGAGSYRLVNTSGREIMVVKAFMK